MEQQYLALEPLSSMSEETLLDLLAQYRTLLGELEREPCRETEWSKPEVRRAIEAVEAEILRREVSAQA